jgi:hypothetical protein
MSNLFNYNRNIYPDRFSRDKNWVKILPVPGRQLQTAELIELQSIQQDNIKQGFNTLFKNGSILSGLKMSFVSSSNTTVRISVSSGQIYVEGIILDVSSTEIEVANTGIFNIGVLVTESIITEEQDPSLRDPIRGTSSFGTPGAHRLSWTSNIVIDDPLSYIIGQISEGSVIQSPQDPFYLVNELLSTYTFERAGNFCVRGFDAVAIPSNQRAISNQSQFLSIQQAFSTAQSEATSSLSSAISAQSNVLSITSQLDEAILEYNSNPTSTNQLIVVNLTDQLEAAKAFYAQTSTLAVTKQSVLQASQASLAKAQALLVDKVLISISPGLAYVGGRRIETTNPITVTVNKDLPTSKVTDALFTYAGRRGLLTRLILLTGASSFLEVKNTPTILVLEFNNLLYESSTLNVSVKIDLSNLVQDTVSEFIDFLISEFNKTSDQNPSSAVQFSGSQPLTNIQLRSILKSSVVLTRTALNNLIFTSTAALNQANEINITSQFYNTNNALELLSASNLISTDVFSSNIYGASQNTNFQLGFTPVSEVIEVVATLEEISRPIVRGLIPGTQDFVGETSVNRIKGIVQGSTRYTEGVDYQIIRQSQIDWSLGGNEPAPGTTYYIDFLYTQPLTRDKDYTFNSSTSEIEFGGGLTPAVNEQFSVTYSYFLAIAGSIGLNSNGEFNTFLSEPSSDPTPPTISPSLLQIASFRIYADKTLVSSSECRTVTFSDLFELEKEIQNNTANIQNLTLNSKAYNKAFSLLGTDPAGMFNDILQDTSKLDIANPDFTAAVSPSVQALTAGYEHKDIPIKLDEVEIINSGGHVHKNYLNEPTFITFQTFNNCYISQPRGTRTIPITVPSPSIVRRARMFVNKQTLFSNKNLSGLATCDSLSKNLSALSRLTNTANSVAVTGITKTVRSLFKSASEQVAISFVTGDAIANVSANENTFLSKSIDLVSAGDVPIEVKIEGLPSNTDGFTITFSGKVVRTSTMTLLEGTPLSVSTPNGLRSNSSGNIYVRFNIPDKTNPGVHLIELKHPNHYAKSRISIYNNLLNQIVLGAIFNWGLLTNKIGSTEFLPIEYTDYTESISTTNAQFVFQANTLPYLNQFPVSESQQYPTLHSSINQIFSVPDYTFIEGVSLFFKSLAVNGNVRVYIKESVNGLPTKTIYGIAQADIYTVSNDGSEVTDFLFSNSIGLSPTKEYCLSVEADAPGFELFVADIGQPDLITDTNLGDQLYLEGNLVLSNNGSSLDIKEDTDLKFKLYSNTFSQGNIEIPLGSYGVTDAIGSISHFCLNSRNLIFPNTAINYEYSTNQVDWFSMLPNIVTCLASDATIIYIKALLVSSQASVSPVINLEGSTISLYSSSLVSTVVSTQVTYPNPYTNLDIIIQYVKPANTNIGVSFSPTNGFAWEGPEWLPVPLNVSSVRLIDPALSLFEATYSLRNLSPFYALSVPRTKFRYRLTFSSADHALQPIVNEVISYVW